MGQPIAIQTLRLVGDATPGRDVRDAAATERAITAANQESASLPTEDARRIFAVRVAEALAGGRAAVLTPDRRRRLVDMGGRLGLRAFDANLVIAIAQDDARRGETAMSDPRLGLVRVVRGRDHAASMVGPLLASAAIALGTVLALIAWLTGE